MKAFAVLTMSILLVGCGDPPTRGDIADRNAADDVRFCVSQYDETPENWSICIDAIASTKNRDPARLRAILNK